MRVSINAESRGPLSKGAVKRLRKDGLIPVTVSAPESSTVQLLVPRRELTEALHRYGVSALIDLAGPDAQGLVIARDVQRQAVTGQLLHVGFRRVSEREPVSAEVSLRLTGEPEAVRTGTAVLEQQVTTVQVRALPDRLPSHVNADTSAMELGGVLHVRDIAASDEYDMVTDPDTVIATVHTVRAAVAPAEEEQAAGEEAAPQAAEGAKA